MDDMRVCIAAVIACLAVAGLTGCAQHEESCAVADMAGAGSGYQTPQRALEALLATHPQWMSQTGWKQAGRYRTAVTFKSGNDTVDVVKTKAGRWVVGATTACQ